MSKKSCIIFGNCQGHAIKNYLEFSDFYETYDAKSYANWELLSTYKMCIPIHDIKNADLVIYQPLSDVHDCYSTNKNNPASFFNLLQDSCTTISFPRIHNNAIFPVFHKKKNHPNIYGRFTNPVSCVEELVYLYDNNLLDYDFTKRMEENYTISKKKEEECDVKIIDYILQNIHKQKMFLTHDHPASCVFNQITKQICDILGVNYKFDHVEKMDENWIGLPDSVYNRGDNQYPISRYAMRHFGFEYVTGEHPDADHFYKQITIQKFLQK